MVPAWHRDFTASLCELWQQISRVVSADPSNFLPTLHILLRVYRSQPHATFSPPASHGTHVLVLFCLLKTTQTFMLKKSFTCPISMHPFRQIFFWLAQKKHSGKFATQPAKPVPFPKSYVHSKEVLLI